METDNTPKGANQSPGIQPCWQWRWFAVGFAVVFVGILFLYPVTTMHPSGQYAVDQRLAAYYADAISRFFRPRILGPATSSSNAFVRIAIEHLVLSAVGGLLTAGIGWCGAGGNCGKPNAVTTAVVSSNNQTNISAAGGR